MFTLGLLRDIATAREEKYTIRADIEKVKDLFPKV